MTCFTEKNTMAWMRVLLVSLLLVVHSYADSGYIITAPKVMIAGTTEKICVTLIEVDGPVDLDVMFVHDLFLISSSKHTMTTSDECFGVTVPSDTYTESSRNVVQLQVVGNGQGDFQFAEEKSIRLKSTKPQTFIQTDKPIYKPGQTVKFRILSIEGTEFKPYKHMLSTVWIENPSGVRLIQWRNVSTNEGLVELEMPLSEEPILGTWKIKCDLEETIIIQHFDVDEYVLPKFEVDIRPPPFVVINDETIDIKICGRYTYGQPVHGSVHAKVCISPSYSYYRPDRPCAETEKKDTGPDGCADFSIRADSVELKSSYYSIWGKKLNVTASFTEENTDITLNATHDTISIHLNPFALIIKAPKSFKPGVPFYGKVKVEYPDGSPADGKLVNLKIDTNNGYIVDKNFTSIQGVIRFSIPDLAIDTSKMNIEARAPGFSTPYNWRNYQNVYRVYDPTTSFSVRPWFSPSGHFLQIEPVDNTLECDLEHDFTIYYTTQEIKDVQLYYKVISHGDIILSGSDSYQLLTADNRETVTTKTAPLIEDSEEKDMELEVIEAILPSNNGPVGPPGPPGPPGRDYYGGYDYRWYHGPDPTVEIANPGDYGELHLKINITKDMAPKCKLLLYYVRDDGEVIADSTQFQVKQVFTNDVSLEFVEEEKKPGAETRLHLKASPGSLCALGVVDKSVHLMKSSNQLTKHQVFDTLNDYDLSRSYGYVDRNTHCDQDSDSSSSEERRQKRSSPPFYYDQGYSTFDDSLKAFEDTGLIVITNVTLETRPCIYREEWYFRGRTNFFDGEILRMASMMSKGDGRLGAPGLAGPVGAPEVVAIDSAFEMEAEENVIEDDLEFTPLVEIRTYFPETWLWQLETVGDNGEVDVNVEVPHTITEWIGSGFCTSSQFGVGVSDTTTLTAFQPFFLSYTLPYSVIRGEKVPVLISVFNYLSECLTIELVLTETDEFENMENSATKQVCVCGGESKAVTYQIVPKTLGEIPITVHAESIDNTICDNNAIMSNRVGVRDALSDDLLVEPEGIEQEFTYSNFICKEENEEFGIFQIELTLPDDVVKGSARGTVSSIGDLMGPTLSGLDRLLRIPCGCGEQTMVTFSPNIFVLQYLTATEQVTASISERAITNMRSGYQRELTYRHDDGSYSAFGERDPEGSTWLTAFVVKSFAQSKQFIFIDDDDLSMSIEWFKQQQRKDTGCFIKRGSVHNKRLKGGVSNDISLTAFVLIAMLEAGIPNNDFSVQLGLKCLEDNMNELNDVYPVAIITYAFSLAGSEHKEFMMQKLNELATVEDGLKYWAVPKDDDESQNDNRPWWYHYHAPSHDVEITSYALLANLVNLNQDDVGDVLPIVRWITKQRNAYGGFSSTQDTILALQVLAQYSEMIYTGATDMFIDFVALDLNERHYINKDNKLVLNREEVLHFPNNVTVSVGGGGCALLQANVKYNIPESPEPPQFSIDVDVGPPLSILSDDPSPQIQANTCAGGDRVLTICSSYLGEDESSNMAIIEVKMVSGYYPSKTSLKDAKKSTDSMAKYEVDGKKVIFYFDEITHDTLCFDFIVEQHIKVEDVKPGQVTVYDYYDRDSSAFRAYEFCAQEEENAEFTACPRCLSSIPENYEDKVCTGIILKVRNHERHHQIKVLENLGRDISTHEMITTRLPNGCVCQQLEKEGGHKMLLLTSSDLFEMTDEEQYLNLNADTYIIDWQTSFKDDIINAVNQCENN